MARMKSPARRALTALKNNLLEPPEAVTDLPPAVEHYLFTAHPVISFYQDLDAVVPTEAYNPYWSRIGHSTADFGGL